MKFKFAPLGDYQPEQIIDINGDRYRVESVTETRRSLSAVSLDRSPNERILVVLTNAKPITEVLE